MVSLNGWKHWLHLLAVLCAYLAVCSVTSNDLHTWTLQSVHTSRFILPCTSDNALRGRPLLKCKPSQFWDTIYFSNPFLYNAYNAMWATVGSAADRS
uniref:Putative secreted protein n=1 Tax=Panstrongylus lignarius TaxID=156445 RepID=A0A224XR49_9HEMI